MSKSITDFKVSIIDYNNKSKNKTGQEERKKSFSLKIHLAEALLLIFLKKIL
jgi:hypothetical protein